MLRYLDLYHDVLIAMLGRVVPNRYTLAPESYLRTALRPLGDLADDISVQGLYPCLAAKNGCRKGHLTGDKHIGSLTLVSLSRLDVDLQEQISCNAAKGRGTALAAKPKALPLLDPCRDMDLQGLHPAGRRITQTDLLIRTECRLLEGYGDVLGDVLTRSSLSTGEAAERTATAATGSTPCAACASEQIAEDIAEHVSEVRGVSAGGAVVVRVSVPAVSGKAREPGERIAAAISRTGTCRLVKCRHAELIVHLLLLRIREHRVGLVDLFELLLCILTRVHIRVILLCQFSVCTLVHARQ